MGLASSQGRLLSLTARLTSNEYESQQISNAKMRLANQTQEASQAYIEALNDTEFTFLTYDSMGNTVNTPLTVGVLYEYAENKNQYILTNNLGKVLLSDIEIEKYTSSRNLMEYLKKNGIEPTFKTKTLQEAYENLYKNKFGSYTLMEWADFWEQAKDINAAEEGYDTTTWSGEKSTALMNYLEALREYDLVVYNKLSGDEVTNADMTAAQVPMENAKLEYTKIVSYESAQETHLLAAIALDKENETDKKITVKDSNGEEQEILLQDLYKYYMLNTDDVGVTYIEQMALYKDELDKLNISANNAYHFEDQEKSQWYTNLWYKLNGPSTDNSGLNNFAYINPKDGMREFKGGLSAENIIPSNDQSLYNSSTWISNALAKGYVHIEKATYTSSQMTLKSSKNPFSFDLNGISWDGKIYSSVEDIIEKRNDKAIARAEVEYQRRTAEINAKDEKYQRQLNLLDTEHHAIQTEYESVKNALNKNMERSFKAFQG